MVEMKVLIIGGTGFIGRHVAAAFVAAGHEVAVFHRGKTEVDSEQGLTDIHGDRNDLAQYRRHFDAFSPRIVVDLAALTEEQARSAVQTFRGRAERIVCASSMDVYEAYGFFRRSEDGAAAAEPFDESAPLRRVLYPYRNLASGPEDILYNYEKILVERAMRSADDLPTTVLRLPQVFGSHDGQHRVGTYLRQMEAGDQITINEEKASWRWTRGYVEDVAAAFVLVALSPMAANQTYNVGEKDAEPEIAWIKSIGRVSGWAGEVRTVPAAGLGESSTEPYNWQHNLAANTERIRQELGYREVVSRHDALAHTIAWERQQADFARAISR
jgi:nucleoside-diphosphate-sugar epimerase